MTPPERKFLYSPQCVVTVTSRGQVRRRFTHNVHWTGHETRCNRQFGKRFGDDAYAMEELVGELGAAFLCADLGISGEPRADHAQYLDHWLKVLKADKKAIFTAASKASEAAAFLAAIQGA